MKRDSWSVLGLAFAAVVGIVGIMAYEGDTLETPIHINATPFKNIFPR